MSETAPEVLDSLKEMEGVIGIALYSKFGGIKYSTLPDWISSETLVSLIDSILEVSNTATHELRRGIVKRTMVEGENGNILISLYGNDVYVFITEKDLKLKLFNQTLDNKELEFKLD